MDEQEKKEKLKKEMLDKIENEVILLNEYGVNNIQRSETIKNLAEAYFKLSISE